MHNQPLLTFEVKHPTIMVGEQITSRRRLLISSAATASLTSVVGCINIPTGPEGSQNIVESAVHIENLDDQPYDLRLLVENIASDEFLIDKLIELSAGPIETEEISFDTTELDGDVSTTVLLDVQGDDETASKERSITSDESFLVTIDDDGEFEIRMRSP